MGKIEKSEIVGYEKGNEILCVDCAGEDIQEEEKNIITKDNLEDQDHIYYCDKCKKKL